MRKTVLLSLISASLSAMLWLAFWHGEAYGTLFLAYVAQLPLMVLGLGLSRRWLLITGTIGAGTVFVSTPLGAAVYIAVHVLPLYGLIAVAHYRVDGGETPKPTPEEDADHPPSPWEAALRPPTPYAAAFPREEAEDGDDPKKWIPTGSLLAGFSVLAACYVLGADLALGGKFAELAASWLDPFFTRYSGLKPEDRQEVVALIAPWFAGGMGSVWVVMTAAFSVGGQALLNRGERAVRPSPVYKKLSLPMWHTWLFVGVSALTLIGALLAPGFMEYTGRDAVLILAVPYFFLGLAVIHTLAGYVAFPGMLLAAVYLGLVATGWFFYALAGLGMIEQWIGLRLRFEPSHEGQED